MKKVSGKKEEVPIQDLIAAQEELKALKKEYGMEEEEKGISKAITRFFDRREAQSQIPLKKKTYLLLAIFTGWMGGHRFYAKQYPTAILYLILFWTGFPLAMTIIDLLIVKPKQAAEQRMITL